MRKLAPDLVAQVVEAYRAGDRTVAQIAASAGCTSGTVIYQAHLHGVATRTAHHNGRELQQPVVWMDAAVCAQVDTEVFFPEKGGSTKEAKSICRLCPVAAECLDFALVRRERFGVWGGLSERNRRPHLEDLGELDDTNDLDDDQPTGRTRAS